MGARKRWGYARQVNGSARPRLFPGEKFHIGLEKWTACAVATGLAPYIPALKDRVLPQLKQLASLTGNFCGARAQKRESNQRRLIANRLWCRPTIFSIDEVESRCLSWVTARGDKAADMPETARIGASDRYLRYVTVRVRALVPCSSAAPLSHPQRGAGAGYPLNWQRRTARISRNGAGLPRASAPRNRRSFVRGQELRRPLRSTHESRNASSA